jgi:hypothetical protein
VDLPIMGTEPPPRPVFPQRLTLSPLFTGVRGREFSEVGLQDPV